jgi:thioredoxin-related protein
MNLIKIFILTVSLHLISYAELINIDNIANEAKKQNKQLLIFFHMTRCGSCKKMIKNSIENLEIRKQISKDFIYIDMNINNDDIIVYKNFKGSIHNFARSFDIHLYPSTIFIGLDNEVKYHLVGYRDKEVFSTIIEYVSTKSYETMDLELFINEKEFKN